MKHIIFDLDLTLVDSTIAEEARSRRFWSQVYSLIPKFRVYPGLENVFKYIRSNGIKVAIVSTAPSAYVQKVVNYFDIPVDVIVGYHDAARKPSPAGMIMAMNRLGANASETISFGDRAIDIVASKAAGIKSVACTWGTKEERRLLMSAPDCVLENAELIIELIR